MHNSLNRTNLTALAENQDESVQLAQLKSLDSISEIISDSRESDLVLPEVLKALLNIFSCDSSWLLCPDGEKRSVLNALFEFADNSTCHNKTVNSVTLSPEMQTAIEQSQNVSGAVSIESQNCFCSESEETLLKSQLLISLQPDIGKAWILGLQYATIKKSSVSEISLFEAISRRVLKALNTQLHIKQLHDSEMHFRALVDSAAESIFVLDADSEKLVEVNQPLMELLGYPEAELLKIPLEKLLAESHNDKLVFAHCLSGEVQNVKWIFLNKEGNPITCEVRLIKLPETDQHLIRGSVVDIHDLKNSEVQMRKLSRALEQTGDSIIITDERGVIEYVNPAFEKITGYSATEIIGKNNNLLRSGKHTLEFYQTLWKTVTSGQVFQEVFTNRRKDGTFYYEEKTISPLKDESGAITHFIASGRDISERMETQERIFYLAHHDVLTDLPNRVLLFDRLEQAIYRAVRNEHMFSVMFLDLDRFKVINDTLGHDTGDLVLQKVAKRLRKALRASDTIARLGGDEFAVLLEDLNSLEHAQKIAENLIEVLSQPIIIDERELFITTSIGISTFPADGSDAKSLLKNADIAMYQAKHLGKNTYQSYNKEMNVLTDRHFTLETELRHALENDQFEVYYQPKIDLPSQTLIGSEALLRWVHPEMGIISPVDFIPLLEETGMIIEVGEWVIQAVCKDIIQWLEAGLKPGAVAINLSVRQFSSPNIENTIINIIDHYEIPPELIEIEITESLLIKNQNNAHRVLDAFRNKGFTLALDDFGTGYSSLSYLKRFPIDVIKIDRSFIKDLPGDEDDTALVSTIVAMAKALKLKTVAEGIETQEQYQHLYEQGCDIGQGFLMSRPIAYPEFTQYLDDIKTGKRQNDYLLNGSEKVKGHYPN